MKNRFKTVALLVSFLLIFSLLTLNTAANGTPAEEAENAGSSFVVPDVIDKDEAARYDYVSRADEYENDLYTLSFRNSDGSYTMRVFAFPVKYTDADGKTQDISLSVKVSENGFEPVSHYVKTVFPETVSDGIRLYYDDMDIRMVPLTDAAPAPSLSEDGKTVTYPVSQNTDLAYSLTYAGFKEDIVVKEYTGQTEYGFYLFTNGLELFENEYGEFFLKDSKGEIKASVGDIIVFTADERNNFFGDLEYETIKESDQYLLTIKLDASKLSDPATVYPIRIDPTVEIKYANDGAGAIEDVTIKEDQTFSGTYNSLYVGRHPAGALSRTLMRFPNLDLTKIAETRITEARIEIRDLMCQSNEDITIECHEYTGNSWSESGTTTWANVGNNYIGAKYSEHLISYNHGHNNTNRYHFDITDLVKEWAGGTALPSKGVVFKANDLFEGQTGQNIQHWYKTFSSYNRTSYRPSFSLTYAFDEFFSLYSQTGGYYSNTFLYNVPVIINNNMYNIAVYDDDGLQLRSNCYGYAMRMYYSGNLQEDSLRVSLYSPIDPDFCYYIYKQQPGEFADKSNGLTLYIPFSSGVPFNVIDDFNELMVTLAQILNDNSIDLETKSYYILQLMQADAAELGYTITKYNGTSIPDARSEPNKRLIALVVTDGDYHFYIQHSDNTWSHKPGPSTPSEKCLSNAHTKVMLDNTNIASHACEGYYTNGVVKFFYVTKNAVVDFKNGNGQDGACVKTSLLTSDLAGNAFGSSKEIGATPISKSGQIDYPGDVDSYAFTAGSSGTYTFSAAISPFSLKMELCDALGQTLYTHTANTQTSSFTFNLTGNALYVVKISDLNTSSYNTTSYYSFSIVTP